MKKEKVVIQYADAQNPPTVKTNFAGTGFVSTIGENGEIEQRTPVVSNTVTKEILWQLNHGKQQWGRYNGYDIMQMFTHCALGDGSIDGTLEPYSNAYVPQEGVDVARKTVLDMFHLDNAKTKFQDSYYTATGFCGSDDMWDSVNRLYTFKFRRSYRFNLSTGVNPFICREVGLFAQPYGYVKTGAYKPCQNWLLNNNPADVEYGYPNVDSKDPDRPEADNPYGYPWDMTARLVLPTPLVVDLTQSIVVTYDFTMTVDCNSQDVKIKTRNTRTGELSDELDAKLGFDFKCARTAFAGYRTLPAPNVNNNTAPGAVWNTVQASGSMVDLANGSKATNSTQSGQNKGFLSNNTRESSADYMYGRYQQDYQFNTTTGETNFQESPMTLHNPGTQMTGFYSYVKTNHARFQTVYTYDVCLPYGAATDPTIYPNEFNIAGIRLWFAPKEYPSGEWHSPIEWRPSRRFFISVSVAISFNNVSAADNATPLASDRNIITEDWGYDESDVANHVYDSFQEFENDPAPVLIENPMEGDKGYFLREWNDGDDDQARYFPVLYKTVDGVLQWWADDDIPATGDVVYHGWDRNISAKEGNAKTRKPFRRGFMLDDRDGNVYMCLCAHFANSAAPVNEYRWIHIEPFRLRFIGKKNDGTPYSTKHPIGAYYSYSSSVTTPFNRYGDPTNDVNRSGDGTWREQADGRLYSQFEAMNSDDNSTTGWGNGGWRGIAPKGWNIPPEWMLDRFFHGMAKGTANDGTGTPSDGLADTRQIFLLPWNGADPFSLAWYYFGVRNSDGWNYRASNWYLWSSTSGRYRYQYSSGANVNRGALDSRNRMSVFCFKD